MNANIQPAMTLTDFLLANPVDNLREKVFVSPRFAEKGFAFTITALGGDTFSEYQKRCTIMSGNKKIGFNSKLWNELIIFNHVVEPNFKDAAFVKRAGCLTSEQCLYKFLKAGEITELVSQIMTLSGYETDMQEAIAEVKNSSEGEMETLGTDTTASTNSIGLPGSM